jgi:hypothetical protein
MKYSHFFQDLLQQNLCLISRIIFTYPTPLSLALVSVPKLILEGADLMMKKPFYIPLLLKVVPVKAIFHPLYFR